MAGGGAGGSCARGGRALAAMLASTQALQRIPGHVGRSKFRNDSRCPKVTSEPARRRLQPEPVSSANCAVVRLRACEVDLMRHRGHWAGIGYEGALFEASCIVRIAVAPVEIELAWPLPAAPSSTTLLRALLRRSQRLDAGETAIELLQSPQLPGYDPRPSSQSTVHPRTRRLEDAKRLGFSACALPRLGRPWHPSLVRVIPALAVRKSLAVPHPWAPAARPGPSRPS
jgi:hypothetical protein